MPSSLPSAVLSASPSSIPSDLDFKFKGNLSKTYDSYVAFKPVKRCRSEQPGTGKEVRKFCSGTCKKNCKKPRGVCENLVTFQFQGNRKFTRQEM